MSASLTGKCQLQFSRPHIQEQANTLVRITKPFLCLCVCVFPIRDCQNELNGAQGLAGQSDLFRQFEGGVKLGLGSFNLVGVFFRKQFLVVKSYYFVKI